MTDLPRQRRWPRHLVCRDRLMGPEWAVYNTAYTDGTDGPALSYYSLAGEGVFCRFLRLDMSVQRSGSQ